MFENDLIFRWFPNNKGMAMGIVVGGFGGGAFVFNQIQVKKTYKFEFFPFSTFRLL